MKQEELKLPTEEDFSRMKQEVQKLIEQRKKEYDGRRMELHDKCRNWKTILNSEEIEHLRQSDITNTIDLADQMYFVVTEMASMNKVYETMGCWDCMRIAEKLGVIQ